MAGRVTIWGARQTSISGTAIDQTYPIARPLFMYTAGQPQGAVGEYLDWVLSGEGQCIIAEKGYAPVRALECV